MVISEGVVPAQGQKVNTYVTRDFVHALVFLLPRVLPYKYVARCLSFLSLLFIFSTCHMAHAPPVTLHAASVAEEADGDPHASAPPLTATDVRVAFPNSAILEKS